VDLCHFVHKDFLSCPNDLPSIDEYDDFSENTVYYFNPSLYGEGVDLLKVLRLDLLKAAHISCFYLTTDSLHNRSNAMTKKELTLSCSRHLPCKGGKLQHQADGSNIQTDAPVIISGVKEQTIC